MFRLRSQQDDLGFGGQIGSERGQRLLERNGQFTVRRTGLGLRGFFSFYQLLLSTTWPRFLLLLGAGYLATLLIFALGFFLLGPSAIAGVPGGATRDFGHAFFLSVHTLSGVGYGHLHPASTAAEILMTIESFAGLLVYALATGLAFARFSRARMDLGFSKQAVIAPFQDGQALMFRVVNRRRNEILELSARVILTVLDETGDRPRRRYARLALERDGVAFFPMTWTVVHPIDEDSPLYGLEQAELDSADAEIMVILKGIDESTSQQVYARTSYRYGEIAWRHRFADIFERDEYGNPHQVDVRRIDEIVEA